MTTATLAAGMRVPTGLRYNSTDALVAAQPVTSGYRWVYERTTTGSAPVNSHTAVVSNMLAHFWQAGSNLFVLVNGRLYVYQMQRHLALRLGPLTTNANAVRRMISGHPYEWDGSLGVWSLAATNPSFAVPSGLDATTAGSDLLAALNVLLQDFTNNGVPSEHSFSQSTHDFQVAWNADPTVAAVGGNALLQVDGGYGGNVHDAVAAINGGSTWPVNTTASSTAPTTPTTPASNTTTNTSTTTTTTTTTPSNTGLIVGALLAGVAIVAGTVYYHHGGGKQMLARRRARRALTHHHAHA